VGEGEKKHEKGRKKERKKRYELIPVKRIPSPGTERDAAKKKKKRKKAEKKRGKTT